MYARSAHPPDRVSHAWLDEVLAGELSARKDVLDIDYERYAQAEAALAWLNFRGHLRAAAFLFRPRCCWVRGSTPSIASLSEAEIRIVHLKAMATSLDRIRESGTMREWTGAGGRGHARCVAGGQSRSYAEHSRSGRARGDDAGSWSGRSSGSTAAGTRAAMRCFRPAAPQPERRVLREEIAARN